MHTTDVSRQTEALENSLKNLRETHEATKLREKRGHDREVHEIREAFKKETDDANSRLAKEREERLSELVTEYSDREKEVCVGFAAYACDFYVFFFYVFSELQDYISLYCSAHRARTRYLKYVTNGFGDCPSPRTLIGAHE